MVKSNIYLEKIIGDRQSKVNPKPVLKVYGKQVNTVKNRSESGIAKKEERLNIYIKEHSQVEKNITTDTAMMLFGGAIGVALISKLV